MAQGEVGLGDLWQTGAERTFTAPEGTVTVWLQKLAPAEQDAVYKMARAKRATVMLAGRDKTSDVYVTALQDAYDLGGVDAMVDYLTADEARKRADYVQAELADAAEWSKDGYLAGLRDQWQTELSDRWLENPEDADAARVFAELDRFSSQVNARMGPIRADLTEVWKGYTEEQLRDETTKRQIEDAATNAFLNEYTRAEMWKCTRQAADHSKPHFSSRAVVDLLSREAYLELQAGFLDLNKTVLAGKDSPASPASSASSEPPAEAETQPSSGLAAASL